MKRNRTLINVLVLCFYLFYSLFPLLYCLEFSHPGDQFVFQFSDFDEQHGNRENGFALQAGQREDSSSTPLSYVLLKKKRALTISFKVLPQLAVMFSGFAPVFGTNETATQVLDVRVKSSGGFQFYHSGISPPAVQSV
jgi:hypothetical protein